MYTHEECLKINKEVGLRYIALSKDIAELIKKFKEHLNDDTEGSNWDFAKSIEIYTKISQQYQVIGNTLLSLG